MNVFVSAAVTADGAMDDCSTERLMISGPEDWAEVLHLRTQFDAILVGAQTVRRDNPSLVIRDEAARTARRRQGLSPDIAKITLTRSGCLPPDARFFTEGTGRKIIFSPTPLSQFNGIAEVIQIEDITAARIVTELEKRGFNSLFVEGGTEVLRMFFAENMVDTLRLAVNPLLIVDDPQAPHLHIGTHYLDAPHDTTHFGTTEVTTYTLHADHPEDLHFLQQAIEVSRHCSLCATSYCVGAVVVTPNGKIYTGYTHETSPTHHAEQEAIAKAMADGAELRGATIYASMEPCSSRKSEPESCSELILRHGFARVVFALYEPDCFVLCNGALNLRRKGVEVTVIPALADDVLKINSHLTQ